MRVGSKILGTVGKALKLPGIAVSFSSLGHRFRAGKARKVGKASRSFSLAGKRCLVTGANAGIGKAVALELAKRDADVWLLCRNRERGERAAAEVDVAGAGKTRLEIVDLSELNSIADFCARADLAGVDLLVHNAGALFDDKQLTSDGFERTYAVHVLGPQALTRGLASALRQAEGRVVYVASGGMYAHRLRLKELHEPREDFDGVRAYAIAKRAQVILAELWAAREPTIDFFAMHPGWVNTRGVEEALPRFHAILKPVLRTPAQGADTVVWLAGPRENLPPSGAFVFDQREVARHLVEETRESEDDRTALWNLVEGHLICE